MTEAICPYCQKEHDCTDGPHGQDEDETVQCHHCDKEFVVTCDYTVNYETSCKPRDHDMVPDTEGEYAWEYYTCSRCDHYFFKSNMDTRAVIRRKK